VYKIPKSGGPEGVTFSLDNAYYFDRIDTLNDTTRIQHLLNIDTVKTFFVNDKLRLNRLADKNVVIHVRLGDAMVVGRGASITEYYNNLLQLVDTFVENYPSEEGYKYYIHSDGDVPELCAKLSKSKTEYIICSKTTPILSVLSDLIHSKILVCGNSCLSKVCSFLGDKELIITNDDNAHSMPVVNCFKISDYLSLQ